MQIIGLDTCPRPARGSVVTIGAYDGVHLGHRLLIAEVRRHAEERQCASAVITFDRHPAMVVRPESSPRLLTDLDQKLELLASTGLDYALVVPFDQRRAAESAEDFVQEVLVGCLHTRAVVVGHDFHFGRGRRGNVPLLQAMGHDLGFDVLGQPLFAAFGVGTDLDLPVSSTRIREELAHARVEAAAALLGRNHEVRGIVEHGDGRGRELGFPTANVTVPGEILLPADGVYAGWYHDTDQARHAAAISLGRRPTFYTDTGQRLLEAHLLDFSGDLYGRRARVEFVALLRDQKRFDGPSALDDLMDQMARDVKAARGALDR